MTSIAIDSDTIERGNAQSRKLRALIAAPEILVMPGAYDTLSALFLESMGFPAVQGSSGAIAAVYGLPDGEVIGRERTTAVYRGMTARLSVPLNADGEKGFGGPEDVAETVRQFVGSGLAGMNLEDSLHHATNERLSLASIPEQLEKIAAFMGARRSVGSEFLLNARVDTFIAMSDGPEALRDAVQRGNAYAEAGADCVFYIRAGGAEQIRTLVKEVRAPVSILAGATSPSVAELEQLGVARVSYGLAFIFAAIEGVKRLGDVLLEKGDPSGLLSGLPVAAVRKLQRA